MRKALSTICVAVLLAMTPSSAFAWGFAAHRAIMRRAIDLLPPEMKPYFEHYRDELVVRAIDPDLWRLAGWDDDANHYVNFGVSDYGPYPFAALPRDWDAAVQKFGTGTLKRNGLLPWREAEAFANLRRCFEDIGRNRPFAPDDVPMFAGVAAHYLQDAHQPLHATNNFDGQMTGQNGLHARFEFELYERFESRLTINPAPPRPITSPRDAAFDALVAAWPLVQPLLDADREAAAGRDTYDDGYFEKFFAKAGPILERQIAASITATASLLMGAWEQAGRPTLKTKIPSPVQTIRRTQPR